MRSEMDWYTAGDEDFRAWQKGKVKWRGRMKRESQPAEKDLENVGAGEFKFESNFIAESNAVSAVGLNLFYI